MLQDDPIAPLAETDLRLSDGPWPFAERNSAEIAAHWAEKAAEKPAMWDGEVLGAFEPRLDNGRFVARLVQTQFSAFLAWRDWGFPDKDYFNPFGSGVIASSDGGYIFAVMGSHTSNAGAVYPCGGSLEPGDVTADGVADIWASTARELLEETGLSAEEAEPGGDFLVFWKQLLSFTRVYRYDMPLKELAARIRANLDKQQDRELDDIAPFKSMADLEGMKLRPYSEMTARYLLREF